MTDDILETEPLPMRPGEILDPIVRLGPQLRREWQPDQPYLTTAWVRPRQGNGFEYRCTKAGLSGAVEPQWDPREGRITRDGSVEWTCFEPATNGIDPLAGSATVGAPAPAGLTATHVLTDPSGNVQVRVSGGVDGTRYRVPIEAVTQSGQRLQCLLVIDVRSQRRS